MATSPPPEFSAIGLAYRAGANRGFVVVRFTVSGTRIIAQDLVSPEPEPINFAAGRLRAECLRLLQEVKEDVESASKP